MNTPKPKRELCIIACLFCRNPNFRTWAANKSGLVLSEGEAKQFILDTCGVKSRNELDTNEAAGKLFHEKVRAPFLAWQEALTW